MGRFESQLPTNSKLSMRHLYLYTHMLIAEAAASGRKVRIVWEHISTASIGPDPTISGGLVMTLPKMAALGTEEDLQLIDGLIAHEILCHGLHTDFTVALKPGIAGALSNILEDPRGELLSKSRYPGANSKIHKTLQILTAKGVFCSPDPATVTPPQILTGWLVTELRSELLLQDCLSGFSREYRKLAIDAFGSATVDQVKAIALKGCHAKNTQGASDAADEIVSLLKMAKENPENQKPNPDSKSGEGSGDGNSTDQAPTKSAAMEKVLSAGSGDIADCAKGLEEVISAALPSTRKSGAGGYQPDNVNEMQELRQSKTGGSIDNRAKLRAGAQKTAALLSLTFEDLIETITNTDVKTTDEGKLNTRKLWRYPLGDDKVFTKRYEGESIDTCFYLLGDESVSMGGAFGPNPKPDEPDTRITAHEACNRVAVAVGEVLHNVSIPVGIATYNTTVREWHSFDDNWASTLQRYQPKPAGGTKTHLAVVWALKKLLDRKEARKILIVITDGDPGDSLVLKAAVDEAASFGVEVRFVLIGSSYHQQYLDAGMASGVALSDSELASAVFGALKQGIF